MAEPEALVAQSFDAGSLAGLRAALSQCGAALGLDELSLARFVLAVNEVATNAVRHGGGRGALRLWRDGTSLWCEVVDQGRGIPRGRLRPDHRPKPGHIGGWGLWLVHHICTTVDIDTGRDGTRVRLAYPL
jgi:serine/threonine-protein kinase RsbW